MKESVPTKTWGIEMNSLEQILENEYHILNKILHQMELQKKALIKYDISEIERETNILLELIRKLKVLEEDRINILIRDFNISKREAFKMRLSKIVEQIPQNDKIKNISAELSKIIPSIVTTNTVINLLTNRALNSLSEIMSFFSNSSTSVCNVKV